MSPSEFEFLNNLFGEKTSKKDAAFRKAISVQERLALSYVSINSVTLPSVLFISHLTKRSTNRTALQIHTTLQDRSIRSEKKGRGADGGDVSRCTSRAAPAVTVSSLWCDGQIPNKPVTWPRNQLLIRYAVTESRPNCHDTVLRYAVTLQVWTQANRCPLSELWGPVVKACSMLSL